MLKKNKKLNETTEDTALQSEVTVEENNSPVKTSRFGDEENRKSGVYVDKAEAEAFLEAQRKKKLRNRIITIAVSVIAVFLIVFIVYNVIFGGNSGFIKFPTYALTNAEPKAVGTPIDVASGDAVYGTVTKEDGSKVELHYSPKDTLLSVKILDKSGNELDTFRSWPVPLESEASEGNPDRYAKTSDHNIISSLVNVVYSTTNLDGGKSFPVNQLDHTEEISTIENGFRVRYTISEAGCSFVVEFYLDEKGDLIVNVPKSELYEPEFTEAYNANDVDTDKKPRLASVTCLPFFGATRQGDSGYFVIPDGSGAVTYFDQPRINSYSEYNKRIYGVDETFDSSNSADPNLNNESILMPVFGIVGDNTMITCFAEEGEANASLVMGLPGVKNLQFYYINYSFRWREYYYSKLSNAGDTFRFLETTAGTGDFKQRYSFDVCSEEESFDYVDVADKTRDFLIEKWNKDVNTYQYLADNVNKLGDTSDNAELMNIRLFMSAVNISSVSFLSEVKVMTTFKDAQNIITDLKDTLKADKVKYTLMGWQNDGYYGNVMKKYNIESALGGKSDLKDLNEWAEQNGVELGADQNVLIVYGKPTGGASLRKSIVKTPAYDYLKYKKVSNAGTFVKDTEYYYMSPLYYDSDMLGDDLKGLDKLGFNNVELQQLGELLYTDYNKENALLRQQALEYYREWITAYKAEFGEVSITYGFDYAASVADNILDVPSETSTLFQLDKSIPFAQIVYHGLVDMYSEPINRTSDNTAATLKAIEYGTFLSYEVTKELTEELKYTDYNSLFKSCYSDLRDQIYKSYSIAEGSIGKVEDATITAHYCVDAEGTKSGNVYCTEYSNGVKVYVNYADAEYSLENGNVIPALGVGVESADGYNNFSLVG